MTSNPHLDESEVRAGLERVVTICRRFAEPPEPRMGLTALLQIHRHLGRFDPQTWFSTFPRLRMNPGWVLDFVYEADGNYGQPRLYARTTDSKRVESALWLDQRFVRPADWQFKLDFALEPGPCFEVLLLAMFAHRFHLHRHSHAHPGEIVSEKARLRQILLSCPEPASGACNAPGFLDAPRDAVMSLAEVHLAPSVHISEGQAKVNLLVWQQPGGLGLRTYLIKPGAPVHLLGQNMLCRVQGGPIH